LWIAAHAASIRQPQPRHEEHASRRAAHREGQASDAVDVPRWPDESGVDRVAYGLAARLERLTAIGNGQVPRVAATAWRLLAC
jgi:DNA (cytosine-5)-methyltransferase 1